VLDPTRDSTRKGQFWTYISSGGHGYTIYEYCDSVAVAREGPTLRGLTGIQRGFLYAFAACTGLRAKECAFVQKSSFGKGFTYVQITGDRTKNRKDAIQPIPSFLRSAIATAVAQLNECDFLWPGGWKKDEKGRWIEAGWVSGKGAGEFLRKDAAKVGIVIGRVGHEANGGRVLDFHSFRHSYISALDRTGLSEGLSRKLARASCRSILEQYTHREFEDLLEAVEAIPVITMPYGLSCTSTDRTGYGSHIAGLLLWMFCVDRTSQACRLKDGCLSASLMSWRVAPVPSHARRYPRDRDKSSGDRCRDHRSVLSGRIYIVIRPS
jgi:hypothetical protein